MIWGLGCAWQLGEIHASVRELCQYTWFCAAHMSAACSPRNAFKGFWQRHGAVPYQPGCSRDQRLCIGVRTVQVIWSGIRLYMVHARLGLLPAPCMPSHLLVNRNMSSPRQWTRVELPPQLCHFYQYCTVHMFT